jgi:hypothetical protein
LKHAPYQRYNALVNINFFDDTSNNKPLLREDVRIRDLRWELSPEKRRIALEFELTPFIERPSLEVYIANGRGEKAGALTIIETLDYEFSVVVHLRDKEPTDPYTIHAAVYYTSLEQGKRQIVHTKAITFTVE